MFLESQPANSVCSVPPDGNLYIGTSASQLLHFVQIPADPADPASVPSFIMASRLEPDFTEPANAAPGSRPGVQQILLLPKVGKACVLCNWTLTFYMLPEFSRAMSTVQVKNCNWVGGLDLNESRHVDDHGYDGKPGVTIMLCTNKRIQVVRITEEARLIRVCPPSLLISLFLPPANQLEHRLCREHRVCASRLHCLRCRLAQLRPT